MENTYGSGSGSGGGGEDVLIQILMCLPIKSLLRFKSVCKSWCNLIESSFFIDLHTSFNSSKCSSSKFGTFILQALVAEFPCRKIKMFMLSSDDGDGEDDGNDEDDDQKKMVFKVDEDLGFSTFYKDFMLTETIGMVGSCNGLICLHDANLRDVYLWNPATRQFRILPKSKFIAEEEIIKLEQFLGDFVAFGFDVKTKDYKVVWITCFLPWDASASREEKEGCMCLVKVYNLSTDSWRRLEGINSLPAIPIQAQFLSHGIYMNGSYFFVGSSRTRLAFCIDGSMLLSFDFTKEIFSTVQFPGHHSRHELVLSSLGDKMAVCTTLSDCGDGSAYYDIWVLNEQGSSVNKESWTKLHSFRFINREIKWNQPKCLSNNGEFALIPALTDGSDTLQLFNLVTKEAQEDFTICHGSVCRAGVYKQSLVSIIGGNGAAATPSRYCHSL